VFVLPSVFGIGVCVLAFVNLMALRGSEATSMVSGFLILLAIASFVGGLLGWLLIMKKKILSCSHCSAVVPAS